MSTKGTTSQARPPYWPRNKPPRADRRVLLALLSGATNLSGYPLSRSAQVSSARVYLVLDRLEGWGWVTSEREQRLDDLAPRRFYYLTLLGESQALRALGLERPAPQNLTRLNNAIGRITGEQGTWHDEAARRGILTGLRQARSILTGSEDPALPGWLSAASPE